MRRNVSAKVDNNERLKRLIRSQIPLSNDVFMIFAKNKKFCQEFLRVILEDKKLKVIENDIQKYLPSAFNKYVTVDMLCKLGDGSIVNVEIQLTKEKEHARRIFTYASKIKNYLTEKGTKYKDLKDIIEIYLTKEDIFKKGSTVYEVEMNIVSDREEHVAKWDAGLKVYYVNTKGLTNKNINEYLKLLTDKTTINRRYRQTSSIKEGLYKKGGAVMSKEMQAVLKDMKEEGRQEGRQEGMLHAFIGMIKDGLITIKDAAKRLNMNEKELQGYMRQAV